MKYYYKVLTKDMQSTLNNNASSNFIIDYKIGEYTYPKVKGSKLFVFDNLISATKFAYFKDYFIFKCSVKKPTKPKLCCSSIYGLSNFWKNRSSKIKLNLATTVPMGTVFCDAVKIIEQVK